VSLLVLNIYHSSSFTKEVLEEAIDKKANKPKHNIIKFKKKKIKHKEK